MTDDRVKKRLKDWALALDQPAYKPGYSPVSQMHRVCTEGAEGMLAHGPPSDGGMFNAITRLHGYLVMNQRNKRTDLAIARLPKECRALVVATYCAEPGNIAPRRKAAADLDISEAKYRERLAWTLGYLDGVLHGKG